MDFPTLLAGLISGALTVPVVGWILQQLPALPYRRMLAVAASFLLGTGAFLLSTYLGYIPAPVAPSAGLGMYLAAWLEVIWPVWAAAFTASQMVLSAYRAATG